MAAVGEEGAAGNKGNLLFQALHLKLLGVHIFRQHHPGEQAAYGMGAGAALGQLPLQRFQHHLPALVIAGADGGHMGVQVEHLDPLGGLHLAHGGRLQGGGLLHKVVLGQNMLLGADPAQTIAGGQNLGEGAQIDHQALGIQALQRGQGLTLEPQLAVGVILHHGDLIAVDDLHEPVAAVQIPGAAGGILEIGDDVDHLYPFGGGQDLFQLLHDHAAVVGGHLDEPGLAGLEGVDGAQVGRTLQQHHVAGVQKDPGGEIQTLLRAGGHQNVVCVGVDVVLGQHAVGNLLAQLGIAFSG